MPNFNTIKTRIANRYDLSENWITTNPILLAGELGVESDTQNVKVGDGKTSWLDLPYVFSKAFNDKASKSEVDNKIANSLIDVVKLEGGLIPSSVLPSYVDDVIEYTTKSEFPQTGTSGKIYIDLSTNLAYRWGGSSAGYVAISPSLALGETAQTAFYGDKGLEAFNHSRKKHVYSSDNQDYNIVISTTAPKAGTASNIITIVVGETK